MRTIADLKGKHIGYSDLSDNPKGGVHKQGRVIEIGPAAVRVKDAIDRVFWVKHPWIDWVWWRKKQVPIKEWLDGGS